MEGLQAKVMDKDAIIERLTQENRKLKAQSAASVKARQSEEA